MARVVGVSRNEWARGAFAALHGAAIPAPDERGERASPRHADDLMPGVTPAMSSVVSLW